MKHEDGYFSGVGGAGIYYQHWRPATDPVACLIIVHGLAEHSGRYMNVVNRFVPLGYAVCGIDHIGHGKSDGRRVYVERFEDYASTLKTFFDMVRGRDPDVPVFLVGHSMGGLIGALYLLDHPGDVSGAVLSGPGIKVPDNISGALILVGRILSFLAPKAGIIQLDADGISRDRAVVDAYRSDPLVHTGKITARLGAEMLKSMQRVTADAGRITAPLMIVQGGDDKLVDPGGARMLYDSVGSGDKSIEIYEGFYHEVFNEPGRERVLNDVEAWLRKRVGEASPR